MEIYRTLQQIVEGTTYHLDRNSPQEPIAILRGVWHYRSSFTEHEILRILHPRVILTEDLIDSRYCAAEDKFYHRTFYPHTTSLQQRLIDEAPIISAARKFRIDAQGIDVPQKLSDKETEEHFFEEISAQARRGGLIYVTIGYFHIIPSSELIQKLAASEIPCVVVYPHSFPKPFSTINPHSFSPINL